MRRSASVLAFLAAAWVASVPAAVAATQFVAEGPAPRVEYWQHRVAEINEGLKRESELANIRVVFLGDSITDFWTLGDNPWVTGTTGGLPVWNEHFAGAVPALRAMNFGVSGDRTEHVLYRLQPQSAGGLGQFDSPKLDPDVVVLMIGINNSWAAEAPVAESVYAGVRSVLAAVHERKPRARIVLQSILPTNDEAKNTATVRPVNARLRALAASVPYAGQVVYLDLYSRFLDSKGMQVGSLFMDGLHPNTAGYRIWADALLPVLTGAGTGK